MEPTPERLGPAVHQNTDLLHSPTIHPQIAVTGPGGGTEMNGFALVVEQKLDVIHEAHDQAGKLEMQIGLVLLDELGAAQRRYGSFQCLFRFCARFAVAKRRDGVLLILSRCGRRYAVGAGGAGSERSSAHEAWTLPPCTKSRNQISATSTASGGMRSGMPLSR